MGQPALRGANVLRLTALIVFVVILRVPAQLAKDATAIPMPVPAPAAI